VSRWPVAGPSEYWILASSPASKVKKQQCPHSTTNTHKITTTQDNYNNTHGQPTTEPVTHDSVTLCAEERHGRTGQHHITLYQFLFDFIHKHAKRNWCWIFPNWPVLQLKCNLNYIRISFVIFSFWMLCWPEATAAWQVTWQICK